MLCNLILKNEYEIKKSDVFIGSFNFGINGLWNRSGCEILFVKGVR